MISVFKATSSGRLMKAPAPNASFLQRLTRHRAALVSGIFLCLLALMAVFSEQIAPYSPTELHYRDALSAPNATYLLGTDNVGRDILSRIIFGSRSSLFVGVLSMTISAVVGVTLGLVAGYYGGIVDAVITRTMDGLLSFPALVLAIFMVSILGPALINAIIAISIVFIPSFVRITRINTLSLSKQDFVVSAHMLGATNRQIIMRHILPNVLSPILVQITLGMSRAILTEASLSFLGLGVQRPTPSWGNMIADGRQFIVQAPWMITFPGLAIFLTVLSFNFLGDGLREALDPRRRNAP
jgi:ABC-type dipeptide/oligopeptide/nickel transport system permease subunit